MPSQHHADDAVSLKLHALVVGWSTVANESAQLNERMKSSDLILAIPRKITPEMVGTTIAQFGSVETKRRGWQFSGKDQEAGQMAWLSLVAKIGGFARFASEPFEL